MCKRRDTTSCGSLVRKILCPPNLRSNAVEWGKKNESTVRRQLAEVLNIQIDDCGLFIDTEISYLAATPDGLIGDDTIVEIKCPYSAREVSSLYAIKSRIGDLHTVFEKKDISKMNKKHNYYFQVRN